MPIVVMYQNEFMQLIAPFKDKVFRLAKRLLTSTEEAEDATQEIMVKLWCRNERLSGYANVEALAMTMTKNHCLDQLKSKRSFNSRILPANYKDREPSLQQKAEDNDSLSWVAKIIEQLPEQQRMIIQLREIEHYEFEEIAKLLEMNETAIRVALSRARKTIRTQMNKIHRYGTV